MADRYQHLIAALPYLRQYVFCITGSREQGDAIIADWLAALVEAEVDFAPDSAVRETFIRFHRHCGRELDGRRPANGHAAGTAFPAALRQPEADGLHRRVQALPLRERQVLALCVVAGFSAAEAAEILDIQPHFVRRLLHRAENGLMRSRQTALVIEDEALQGMEIALALSQMGFEVAPLVCSRSQALASAERLRPDLIVADLRLANGDDGIDTVRSICFRQHPAIVYVTAFPERAHAVDEAIRGPVLSKPVTPAKLMTTVHAEMARVA